jgi:pre-mRNA-splicing factor RBM22/SLT11
VRDTILKKHGIQPGMEVARPQSETMVKYQADLNAKALASGAGMSPLASQVLQGIGKSAPDYRRNRTKICSFFLKGTCNRGEMCPFRHEQSDHTDVTLAAQNIKDRYYGTEDPLAQKILDRAHDPKNAQTTGPEVSTVWVSGVLPEKNITEQDLKDHFYSFGEILKIRIVPTSKCAFVEYVSHDEASRAIETLRNNLVIRGQFLKVGWAKPQNPNTSENRKRQYATEASQSMPPPPGFVPYNPTAPGAPPPGAAGPLGWAPMYYPSMNPQRMGAVEASDKAASSSSTSSSQAHSAKGRSRSKSVRVEEPDEHETVPRPESSSATASKAESSVSASEVEETDDVPPGSRRKRSGGAEASHDGNDKAKKIKV